MNAAGRQVDPALRDLSWTGYHPRATAPAVVLMSALSLLIWTGRWYFEDISAFAERVGGLALFAMAWGAWPALGAILLYRAITFTYRITDRALLVDFGFLSRPVPAIPWSEVEEVTAGSGWLAQRLGVGWVDVKTSGRTVHMTGVRRPEEFAETIRSTARDSRKAGGHSTA